MNNQASRTLFLAVPGTQDTRELGLDDVRNAVARGEIALDNWAWSPTRNEWVPLSQLPEFAAAPAAAPAPAIAAVPVAAKAAIRASMPAKAAVSRTATAANNNARHAATYYSKPIEEHHEFPVFKVLFVVLGAIIAALVGVNYCLVDQPFRQNLAKTPFANVQAHAHLGAFVQPGVMLIHIIPTEEITSDNFADFSWPHKILDYLWHITLPVASLVLGSFATSTLLTKNSFLDEIKKSYVQTARMKGLSERRVLYGHVFRNAMLIVIAGFPGAFIGAFFTGSLLIEQVFSLDGLGYLSFDSLMNRDYPVVLGNLYIFALLGLVVNLVSDLTYTWIDPRIDFETREV